MKLEAELRYFECRKAELLKHKGKYALIIGQELLGIFDTREEAYKVGVEKRGNIPMLIKFIQEKDEIETMPAMTLGLLRANL